MQKQLRDERSVELKGLLDAKDYKELFNEYNIFKTSNFVYKLFRNRFGSKKTLNLLMYFHSFHFLY